MQACYRFDNSNLSLHFLQWIAFLIGVSPLNLWGVGGVVASDKLGARCFSRGIVESPEGPDQ